MNSDSSYEVSFWCFTQDAQHASLCLALFGLAGTVTGARKSEVRSVGVRSFEP